MDAAWMVDGWCWIWWLRELPEPRRVTHLFGWLLMVIWVLTNALACGRRRRHHHHHHHPSSIIRHPSSIIRHPSSVIRHPSSVIRHPSSVIHHHHHHHQPFLFSVALICFCCIFWGWGCGWSTTRQVLRLGWIQWKLERPAGPPDTHMIATCLPVKTWAAMGWTRIKWMVFSATRVFLGLGFS